MTIKTMNIVVTGSAGFLGSPLCFDLLSLGLVMPFATFYIDKAYLRP